MRIIVTGGSGFIGRAVCKELVKAGHTVIVLTRDVELAGPALGDQVETVEWEGEPSGPWMSVIEGADAVINLAGESIASGRWTKARKERIIGSREKATNALVQAIAKTNRKPSVMINASAIGYYGAHGDEPVTEQTPPGNDFLAETVRRWEEAASKVVAQGVRLVILRLGVVLGEGGGALEKMLVPFRLFVGGAPGTGKQWFSWVHVDDAVGFMLFALKNNQVKGVFNVAAPEPQTMSDFCRILGKVMGRPSWAPVPGFVLKAMYGEMSETVLTGQRVSSVAAAQAGYSFKYRTSEQALADILRR